MESETIQEKVHRILGRPISCMKFQSSSGKDKFLPLYLNYKTMGDGTNFVGDSETECYEKLYHYLLENKDTLTE